MTRIPARMFFFIVITAGFTMSSYAQVIPDDGNYIEIKVYGDAGAKALMQFGNHVGNTRTLDSANSLDMWKENEPPPPGPGFDAVWGPITPGQFGAGLRGLIGRDFRSSNGSEYESRVDTFDLKFVQADNGGATISFKWSSALWICQRADSLKMTVFDPTHGNYQIDMMARDTLAIPTAGDDGVAKIRIFKYGSKICCYYCGCGFCLDGVEDEEQLPDRAYLTQNYPNPFNPATEIRFEVPVSGLVSLKVFDVLGREVATLVNEQKSPGSYTVNWDALGQTSGVYYYRLQTEGRTVVKKMMLVR